jgi:predicted nucleotidyltransferase
MIPTWIDNETHALIADLIETAHEAHEHHLLAVLLYGSVARHEERPLDDPEPSDVDLLMVFDTDDPAAPYTWGINDALGAAYRRHLHAPREVNIMFATRDLAEWDETFIENVARDGLLLYGTHPLPLQPETAQIR